MACNDATCDFKPMRLRRRALGPRDIEIDMKYCGICHTDLHTAADHLPIKTRYPCVPGHELAGIAVAVGADVRGVAVGDPVGVGCLVDSCLECAACEEGRENLCRKRVGTYGGEDTSGRARCVPATARTYGGYTNRMVVDERFAIRIPKDYPLECAGPVFCAGVTMYDPLKRYGAGGGTRVGVVGLGGLGVMGVKLARALGCDVVAISRGDAKARLAKDSGATSFLNSEDAAATAAAARTLDLVLDTVPAEHDWAKYRALVKDDGKLVILGVNAAFAASMIAGKLRKTCSVVSSTIGGIPATQEVVDLCAREKIYPDVDVVPVRDIGRVYEALDATNDAGRRYVLDLAGTLDESAFEKCDAPPPTLAPNGTGLTPRKVVADLARMVFCY